MVKHRNQLIYLASPYSHECDPVRELRFRQICEYAGYFMSMGYDIYSPIAHSHSIAVHSQLPTDWQFWRNTCTKMISKCDEFWVLTMDGWATSIGVREETKIAKQMGKNIKHVSPPKRIC